MRNLFLAILVFCNVSVFAQFNSSERIEIEYVTVNPISPNVTVSWKPYSKIADIDGYIICQFAKTPGEGLLYKEFAEKTETQLSFQFDDVSQYPVQFAVIAYTGSKTPLNILNRTIYSLHRPSYLSLHYDSCASAINLKWTKYLGWGNAVSAYRILDAAGQQVASVSGSDSTYSIPNANANQTYSYSVRAIHNNGINTSNSNVASIYTKSFVSPAFINVRDVNVVQNTAAEITFYIDPASELRNFRLLRSEKPSGGFQIVKEYNNHTSNTLIATDESLTDSTFYYKLQVLNNCGEVNNASNLATVIVPVFALNGQQISLKWDAYLQWPYGIREYRIFRSIGNETASQITATGSTYFNDDLSSLSGQQLSGNICYFIETLSNPDGSGNASKAISRSVCVDVASQIFIPQAFTPNGDGKNDEFKPSFAFLPADYTMLIFNRKGSMIFESKVITKGWNGLMKGGVKAPEGSYIYFITFTTSSGNRIEKRGSFTVIYP